MTAEKLEPPLIAQWREMAPDFLQGASDSAVQAVLEPFVKALKKTLLEKLQRNHFWLLSGSGKHSRQALFECRSGLLWECSPNITTTMFAEAPGPEHFAKLPVNQLASGWRVPTHEEFSAFVKNPNNPLRQGNKDQLLNESAWMTTKGLVSLNTWRYDRSAAYLCACSADFAADPLAFLATARREKWRLIPLDGGEDILPELLAWPQNAFNPALFYQDIDYRACRLPRLEPAQFTDPNQGLWEFFGANAADLEKNAIRARNPALDVRNDEIAIDFGTSSTVVAYNKDGKGELLRIGVKDFWEAPEPYHYENPTVLEFLALRPLLAAWQEKAYRPEVSWDQVRCSHEALLNLRNNATDPAIVSSILAKIKQWALHDVSGTPWRITDQRESFELELPTPTPRMPVKGQALGVSAEDAFDPLELYAWFLGMTINWRKRGLFLRYYMSFPVAYPRDAKDKILAAFRRGLQRSLPETLIEQPGFLDRFLVEELASEPAAYAAAAMPILGVEPTENGVAYGVFDFGGGTTDFDFGYYRLPDADEEDAGYESVFEHIGSGGDIYLGGENLLENLAYRTFQHNLETCRQKKIAFTRPDDAENFPGSEMFLEKTQAALTNTLMLMSRLRPFWEQGELSGDIIKIDLLTREGGRASCELALPREALQNWLEERITHGVCAFYTKMKNVFGENASSGIHVLLAGNASRARQIAQCFGLAKEETVNEQADEENTSAEETVRQHCQALFGQTRIICHPPLPIVASDPYRPTTKTGVALGLLKLGHGSVVKAINRAEKTGSDEAPFAHYLGPVRRGKLHLVLKHGDAYNVWKEFGRTRARMLWLYHTTSPHALSGNMAESDPQLHRKTIEFSGDCDAEKVYVRPISTHRLELCTAISPEAVEKGEGKNMQFVEL